jgi:nucleotide-binding universal stress UspA family protein
MRLAKQLDAHLILLHVIDPAESTQHSTDARDQMNWQLGSVGIVTRRQPEIRVQRGNYVESIAAVANETDADIIVLGAQSRKALAPFIGTTAERITALAGRPVLIVNQEPHLRYGAVVIAGELSSAFVQVVRVASSLKFLDAGSVSIVHGFEFPRGPLFAVDARTMKRNLEAWEKAAKARLLQNLDVAGVESSRFRIVFHQTRPIRAIQRAIRDVKPELLIVGAKDRSIFNRVITGSVANDALRSVECDILVAEPKVESMSGALNRDVAARNAFLKAREQRLS